MKKIVFIFVCLFTFCLNVNASTFETSMSGVSSIDAKEEFTITINVSGTNIWGITMGLNYDSSKIELVKSQGQSDFTATVGKNIVLDSTSGHNGNFKAIILTFKAKDDFIPGQSTTITLSNVKASSDSEMMSGSGCSKTIKVNVPKSSNNNLSSITIDGESIVNFDKSKTSYDIGNTTNTTININATSEDSKAKVSGIGDKKIEYGVNTFSVVVTAENGSKKTYTIKISRPDTRSKDNSLSSLSVNPLKLNFSKDKTNYVFTVLHEVDSINIVAVANDSKANVSGTGNKKLKDYSNVFSIVVTAENGSKKTYTITVNRKDEKGNLGDLSSDNKLKEIVIEGFDFKFSSDKNNYTYEVDNSVDKVEIKVTANHSKANVVINNVDKLKVGNNVITIDVTAENGDIYTYTINLIRRDNVPVTTIEKLKDIIEKTEKEQIIVEIKDNNSVLTTDIIKIIKDNKKEILINKYDDDNIVYSWIIDGKNIDDIQSINTGIKFNSNNSDIIDKITNYANSIYLNFEHSGKLPDNTKVKVYVGNKYLDNSLLNIYYFNEEENKLEQIKTNVNVIDGYVEFGLEHCSEYIITRSNVLLSSNDTNIFMITTIIELIIICGMSICMILLFKKLKRVCIK